MRAPLTVRISDGVRDQQVTRFVKGLRFTKTAPGGHHSASVSIDAPEGLLSNLGPADRLFIYNGRTARTLWDGYVDNTGRSVATGGESYDVSAMGGVTLASDNGRPVVFVDRELGHEHWRPVFPDGATIGIESGAVTAADPGMKIQWTDGTPVGNQTATMLNDILTFTNQPLSMASVTVTGGKTDATYQTYTAAFNTTTGFLFDSTAPANLTTVPTTVNYQAGVDFVFAPTTNPKHFALVLYRNSVAAGFVVADDTTFAVWRDVVTMPALKAIDGTYVLNYNLYTLPHQVVSHLVGDGMLQVDASDTTIESSVKRIEQLAYLDGAKPSQILDDLELYEPDFLWEILESNQSGKHRFAYRAWPTTPRYEISGRDFTESGGETDLCNRVIVSWKDEAGAKQILWCTSNVPELGTRTKDAEPITLPDGQGSLANAQNIGNQVLAALNTPSRAGTAVVGEPILDRLTGLTVMPWEIEPGYLVRVRDRGLDLRLTEMTYDDGDCSASLTLGSPMLTLAQRIAGLST